MGIWFFEVVVGRLEISLDSLKCIVVVVRSLHLSYKYQPFHGAKVQCT